MLAWSYWLPDLLPTVPGCPQAMAVHEVRRAAQALLRFSRAWQVDLAPVAVSADAAEVTLTAPTGAEIVQIERVRVDGKRLDQVSPENLDTERSDDWTAHTGSEPTHFVQLRPETLRLYPIPSVAASTGLQARVSLCPSDASTALDDALTRRYRDVILAGAKARLLMLPNKPWSNPDLGTVAARSFEQGMDSAHHDTIRGFGRGVPRARPSWC